MSLRTEEVKEELEVPTKEGVTVRLEASLLYALHPDHAADVFKKVGPEYANKIIIPQFRSAARATTVNYDAKDLYTGTRSEVELALENATRELVVAYGIRCEKVLLRKMDLPPSIKASIDQKMVADQKAQKAMEYELKAAEQGGQEEEEIEAEAIASAKLAAIKIELETAEQESKKKQIEAQATAQAAEIVIRKRAWTGRISATFWVQALETAAKNHTTTIYVPTGKRRSADGDHGRAGVALRNLEVGLLGEGCSQVLLGSSGGNNGPVGRPALAGVANADQAGHRLHVALVPAGTATFEP